MIHRFFGRRSTDDEKEAKRKQDQKRNDSRSYSDDSVPVYTSYASDYSSSSCDSSSSSSDDGSCGGD